MPLHKYSTVQLPSSTPPIDCFLASDLERELLDDSGFEDHSSSTFPRRFASVETHPEGYMQYLMQSHFIHGYMDDLLDGTRLRLGLEAYLKGLSLIDPSLERTAILRARGSAQKDVWLFSDGDKNVPVQSWIDEHDKKYGALFLHVDGFTTADIYSERAAVFTHNELYVPMLGYVDSYIVEDFAKKMSEAADALRVGKLKIIYCKYE